MEVLIDRGGLITEVISLWRFLLIGRGGLLMEVLIDRGGHITEVVSLWRIGVVLLQRWSPYGGSY